MISLMNFYQEAYFIIILTRCTVLSKKSKDSDPKEDFLGENSLKWILPAYCTYHVEKFKKIVRTHTEI